MPTGINRKAPLPCASVIAVNVRAVTKKIAIELSSVNIQYSLRRERPSNSAYFLQTIKYHSIAYFLSSLILEPIRPRLILAASAGSYKQRKGSLFWRRD